MVDIIHQRENYLKSLREKTQAFWDQVVAEYNQGTSPKDIAAKHINPKTGKQYSRQHIHAIIKTMRG